MAAGPSCGHQVDSGGVDVVDCVNMASQHFTHIQQCLTLSAESFTTGDQGKQVLIQSSGGAPAGRSVKQTLPQRSPVTAQTHCCNALVVYALQSLTCLAACLPCLRHLCPHVPSLLRQDAMRAYPAPGTLGAHAVLTDARPGLFALLPAWQQVSGTCRLSRRSGSTSRSTVYKTPRIRGRSLLTTP